MPDDQFGGPEADDAHFTGVILRLNDDGSTPTDNPFFAAGAAIGGEVGANIQKIFAYGVRNSFGMAFDPLSGNLWDQENGEDAFDEINLVEPGMNSGWIQIMGPAERVAEYKEIETTSLHHEDFPNLQQFRWGPERIADTPEEAFSRLFMLPGSHYSDPEFSWRHVLAPAAIGFLDSRALGPQYDGDLFVGFSVNDDPLGGGLMRFKLTGNRRKITGNKVADNDTFHDLKGSETRIVGRDFGILTDIQTGPEREPPGRVARPGQHLRGLSDQMRAVVSRKASERKGGIMRRPVWIVSAIVLMAGLARRRRAPRTAEGRSEQRRMTGAEEAPGPGDPDGSGEAVLDAEPRTGRGLLSAQCQRYRARHGRAHPRGSARRGRAGGRRIDAADRRVLERLRQRGSGPDQGHHPEPDALLRQRPQRPLPGRSGSGTAIEVAGGSRRPRHVPRDDAPGAWRAARREGPAL